MAYFGALAPYLRGGMGGGPGMGAAPMTPGAGEPPYGNMPMSLQRPQMGQPGIAQGMPATMPQQQQAGMNPAGMGMLAGLMQAGQAPGGQMPWSKISPQSMEGVIPGMSGQEAGQYMQGLAPDAGPLGWLRSQFGIF